MFTNSRSNVRCFENYHRADCYSIGWNGLMDFISCNGQSLMQFRRTDFEQFG
jgi:hypothetical protein